jgi:membrane-associated protein
VQALAVLAALQGLADEATGSPVTYLVVFLSAGADVLFPLVPSETIVLAAAVKASQGQLLIWILVPATAIGAIVGDNIAYFVGAKVGDPVVRRVAHSDQSQRRLRWAERAIRRRGALVIVAGRFVPGGRTASTLAAGTLQMPWRRFIVADIVAATVWALYVTMIGYFVGEAFHQNIWKALGASLGAVVIVGCSLEGWRRLQQRRGKDILGDRLPAE